MCLWLPGNVHWLIAPASAHLSQPLLTWQTPFSGSVYIGLKWQWKSLDIFVVICSLVLWATTMDGNDDDSCLYLFFVCLPDKFLMFQRVYEWHFFGGYCQFVLNLTFDFSAPKDGVKVVWLYGCTVCVPTGFICVCITAYNGAQW